MGHRPLSGDLIVVLDGGAERLARADQFRRQVSLQHPEQLLIRCPRSSAPPTPLPELLQGYDTANQITALADWLRRRQAQPPQRLWIATDPEHTARATLLARIALAGRGIQIQPDPPPPPGPGERRKLVAVRFVGLQLLMDLSGAPRCLPQRSGLRPRERRWCMCIVG